MTWTGRADGETSAAVLKVRDLTYPLDEIAGKARQATSEFYKEELKKSHPASVSSSAALQPLLPKLPNGSMHAVWRTSSGRCSHSPLYTSFFSLRHWTFRRSKRMTIRACLTPFCATS